jgi:crotonobetainyl-CoA:carnitine CoA-transferase CaiB-like acyl-CoA transferase
VTVLDDVLVVELADGVAGPAAGMFLADYGARVVKVETGAGDPYRERAGFQVLNRGKESLLIQPDDPASMAELRRLLTSADICIRRDPHSWRPYGLDDDLVRRAYRDVIVVSMPPFDEATDGRTESHEVLSASLGMAMNQCSFTGGPIEMVEPHLLYVQGALGALAAVAALVERDRTGRCRAVTVSGVHAFVAFAPQLLVFDPTSAEKSRDLGPGGAHPTYTSYATVDGRWIFVGALTDKFIRRALSVFRLDDLLADPRIAGQTDRLYSPDHRRWVRAVLAERLATDTAQAWIERLEAADIPVAPVQTPDEWFAHPQFLITCGQSRVDHPTLGTVQMPGSPFRLTRTPAMVSRPAPGLGQWDADRTVPARPPHPPGPDDAVNASAGPLAGLRVLSLGAYVAGPYAARLLHLFGADVIKVEPPAGDPWRRYGFQFSEGMRSLAVDLRTPAGQQVFRGLVATADAVIDNFRPGFLASLGADHPSLAEVKPDLVTTSLTGFGEAGPLARRPGFDPVLGALSGMQAAQGGDAEPVVFSLAVNDTCGAVLTALATTLALRHRRRTGAGQHVECSLAGASSYLQVDTLVRYAGRPPIRVGGRDFRGCHAWARYYRASDGWVRIEAVEDSVAMVARLLGVGELPEGADLAAAIAAAVERLDVESVIARLDGTPALVVPAQSTRRAVVDPRRGAPALAHLVEPLGGRPYYTAGDVASIEDRPSRVPAAVPGVGEHTRDLLAEIGIDASRCDELIRLGAVRQEGPYVPVVLEPYR